MTRVSLTDGSIARPFIKIYYGLEEPKITNEVFDKIFYEVHDVVVDTAMASRFDTLDVLYEDEDFTE